MSLDKLLTDERYTLLTFNGSAFAVRFSCSGSAILFSSEVALLWKKDYLGKTTRNWLCGYDVAFVKLFWPLVGKYDSYYVGVRESESIRGLWPWMSLKVIYQFQGFSKASCLHLWSAAIYKISMGTPASRGPSETAGLFVCDSTPEALHRSPHGESWYMKLWLSTAVVWLMYLAYLNFSPM